MTLNSHFDPFIFNKRTPSLLKSIGIIFLEIVLFSQISFAQHPDRKAINALLKELPVAAGNHRIDCLNLLSEEYWWFARPISDSIFYYAYQANLISKTTGNGYGYAMARLNLGVSAYYGRNYKQAEVDLLECIRLSQINYNAKILGFGYLYLGAVHYLKNEYPVAESDYEKAGAYLQETGSEEGKGRLCAFRSILYTAMGNYKKGFEYCQKSLMIRSKMSDTLCILFSYNSFGNLFKAAGDYETALAYYELSLQYAKANNLIWDQNEPLGTIYCRLNKYDSSFYYLFKSLKKNPNDPLVLQSLSETYLAGKNYDSSLKISLNLINIFRGNDDQVHLMISLLDAGKSYAGKNNFKAAQKFTSEGLSLAKKASARQSMIDGYQLTSTIYSKTGKFDSAFIYSNKYTILKDSVLTQKFLSKLNYLAAITEDDKKQARLKLLDKDNKIKEGQLKQQSLVNKILIASIFIFGLLGFIIFRNFSLKKNNDSLQNKKKQAELQQQATELKMQTLRTQMNPHFIFNSLNSINRFILENNKPDSSRYLTKFSRLIRMILQNSQSSFISLKSELESLELYLDMEVMRFDSHFTYKIIVSPELNTSRIKIPPLIIQPYVENAIWHGLMHKEEKGELEIEVVQEEHCLYITITDNGIGREQAARIASKSATKHKSMGLLITADRIAMIQSANGNESSVMIKDLVHSDGSAAGTEVQIKIPVTYD
jgi:tetratricopeptide (TPR) repeat protein/anti-sigma regulatory factor (Ser/Thr protein kinase)